MNNYNNSLVIYENSDFCGWVPGSGTVLSVLSLGDVCV